MRDLCQTHKLVIAPDGKCVLCRSPAKALFTIHEEQETLISQVFTSLLGVGLLVGAISLVYVSRLDPGYTGGRVDRRSLASSSASSKKVVTAADPAQALAPDAGQAALEPEAAGAKPSAKTAAPKTTKASAQPKPAEAPASAHKGSPHATPEALRGIEVTLYTTPWCGEICDRARYYLGARGVTLIERDIESDPAAAQKLAKLNPDKSVPTFEIAGRAHVGFNPWEIEDALNAAAQQRYAARKP